MKVREALAADIPALTTLRMALFCEVGELAWPDEDPVLREATQAYFIQAQERAAPVAGWWRRRARWWRAPPWHSSCARPTRAIWRGGKGTCSTSTPGRPGADGEWRTPCWWPWWRMPASSNWASCGSMPAVMGALSTNGSALPPIPPASSAYLPVSLLFFCTGLILFHKGCVLGALGGIAAFLYTARPIRFSRLTTYVGAGDADTLCG